MIVYDITNLESFNNLTFWINLIKNQIGRDSDKIFVMIIGNKKDSNEREVKMEEAMIFSKQLNYPYFEVSAKTGENVDSAFLFFSKKVLENIIEQEKNGKNNIKISKQKEDKNCHC